jgi:hypothetical protein
LVEIFPADSQPRDALKAAVFARINRDRAAAGLSSVAWDEAASRVADAFCVAQVREASRGHFLMDGIPPYARTGLAGVFGVEAQNSVSWTTTARRFSEPALKLAILGHEDMMAEKPPADLTQDKIRVWPNREFAFLFAPDRPGLYTLVFYMIVGEGQRPRPGASATLRVKGD